MFLILGSTWKYKEVSDGMKVERHCPECGATRRFQQVRPTEFFTLFFVPLVKVSERKPILECLACRSKFSLTSND